MLLAGVVNKKSHGPGTSLSRGRGTCIRGGMQGDWRVRKSMCELSLPGNRDISLALCLNHSSGRSGFYLPGPLNCFYEACMLFQNLVFIRPGVPRHCGPLFRCLGPHSRQLAVELLVSAYAYTTLSFPRLSSFEYFRGHWYTMTVYGSRTGSCKHAPSLNKLICISQKPWL